MRVRILKPPKPLEALQSPRGRTDEVHLRYIIGIIGFLREGGSKGACNERFPKSP